MKNNNKQKHIIITYDKYDSLNYSNELKLFQSNKQSILKMKTFRTKVILTNYSF